MGFGHLIGFANARLERVGKCKHEKVEDAIKAGQELELPKDELGNYLDGPFGGSDVLE